MRSGRTDKADVLQGTLILLVLRTLEALGPLHGYGIARRIEQISKDVLQLNQGTLYPALLRMEQEGWIASKWGASEKNRKARFYSITAAGRRRLAKETEDWKRMSSTIERFLGFDPGSLAEEQRMSWASVVAARLRGLFEHKRLERELDDEVRFHLEMQIEDNLKAGMNPAEARYAALRSFGAIEPMKESVPRTMGIRPGRNDSAGHTLRASDSPQEPRLYDDRRSHTGAGDWRQYRNVQRAEYGSAPAASLSSPRTVGDVVERDSESERARRQVGISECRTVAEPKQELRGHGRL